MGTVVRIVIAIVIVIAVLSPSPLAAQGTADDEARALFEEASGHIRAGDLAAGRDLLERSLELAPRATTAFNLAVVLRAMGRSVEAGRYLEALAAGRYGELSSTLRVEIGNLSDQVDGEVVRVVFTTDDSESATVSIDGDEVGTVAANERLEARVDPGEHTVEARTADGRRHQEELSVVRGDYRSVALIFADVRSENGQTDDGGSFVSSPWFWIGAAAVVAAAAIVTVLLVSNSEPERIDDEIWGSGTTLLSF